MRLKAIRGLSAHLTNNMLETKNTQNCEPRSKESEQTFDKTEGNNV